MLGVPRIELQAHNADRNHHRAYDLSVGRDLLDDWVVEVRFARVGCEGASCAGLDWSGVGIAGG